MVPPAEINESFVYLGKSFNFHMSIEEIKSDLLIDVNKYLDKINRLPLHPKNKIKIVTTYVMSKLRWRLTIYQLSETWICENLDNRIKYFIRQWLQIPRSSNINHLRLSVSQFGFGLQLFSDVYKFCKITVRSILKNSINSDIKELFKLSYDKNINTDRIVKLSKTKFPMKLLSCPT